MARYITRRSYIQQQQVLNYGRRRYASDRKAKGPLKGTGSANIVPPGTYGGSTTQGQPSTYGLNAANQELAELGMPIPLLFGKRRDSNGGFINTPQMIYQRMYSAGAYEETRIGFVVGEGGEDLNKPSRRGIRIGKDLLHSKQSDFWEIRFTDGTTRENDPTKQNTSPWGGKYVYENTLGNGSKFFAIRDPDKEVRGLCQSFDPSASFGLESEPPDCQQTNDPDFSSLVPIPDPTSSPLIKYSPVDASISNTRSCRGTEFGFAVNIPQPSPVSQEDSSDGVPVGSKWMYVKQFISPFARRLCWDGGVYDPIIGLPLISGNVEHHNNGMKIEIISLDTAFYALYRPFYKTHKQEELAKMYSRFQASWGQYILYIDYRKLPSPIWASKPDEFTPSVNNYSYFQRQDGQFSDGNFNNQDPCEFGYIDPESLLDARVPKMFFKLYYRKIEDNNNDWRLLHKQPFCFLSPNSATLYASLKVHHPRLKEEAYEYKFKPQTPVQVEEGNQATYEKCKYGVKTNATPTDKEKSCILYPGARSEQSVNAEDGFKLTFEGLIEPVQSEVKLDVQSENFNVNISYVNEFVKDDDVNYPHMSIGVLEVRAGKGISSLDQLSFYHNEGMNVKRVDQSIDSSALFPDLCYYMLTQYPGNSDGPVAESQVDLMSFTTALDFTASKNLKYNGVITERVGIHEFISEHAKYFLLRFGTNNGRYTLYSALNDSVTNTPTADRTQVVTLDMIDDGSFSIDYATLAEREEAKMQVIWRRQDRNMPGINESVTVQPIGYEGPNKVTHDISGFCTSKEHALTVARFLSALRQEQDRVVTFTCADSDVDLAPGRLFTFNIVIETSVGNTYTNTDQYQVTSRTYREDGTLDVRAVYMPAGINDMVFTDQEFEEVD